MSSKHSIHGKTLQIPRLRLLIQQADNEWESFTLSMQADQKLLAVCGNTLNTLAWCCSSRASTLTARLPPSQSR